METGLKKIGLIIFIFIFSLGTAAALQLTFEPAAVHATQTCTPPPSTPALPSKTGFYVLAFDNGDKASFNLEAQYDATVNRLVLATGNVPNSLAIILADLGGPADTHIIIASSGVATNLDCLPNETGLLDPTIEEYDVADGETLGNFLVWGVNTFNPGSNMNFSFVGHGNPVTPHTIPSIYSIIEGEEREGNQQRLTTQNQLSPLPSRLGANPSFTDHHAPNKGELSLITPHALATAFSRIGQGGNAPFVTIDLLHCFAASIDELYEVAPFGSEIIASPNYAFYDPTMPGIGFEQSGAEDIIAAYDVLHPATGHPHIIMGIEADTVLDSVEEMQKISAELLNELDAKPEETVENLLTAYMNSVHYDTTICEDDRDWELAPPDALVDLKSFAQQLRLLYLTNPSTPNTELVTDLTNLVNALEGSILTTAVQNGPPYFDEEDPQTWEFVRGESGVSLFAPFMPTEIDGTPYLPWQTLWYTNTRFIQLPQNVTLSNPHPFSFIDIDSSGNATWADVLAKYWALQQMRPGRDISTFFCPAEMVSMSTQAADLALDVELSREPLTAGEPFSVTLTVTNRNFAPAVNPEVLFMPHSEPVGWLTLTDIEPIDQCTEAEQEIRCGWKQIPVGGSNSVVLTYMLDALVPVSNLEGEVQLSSDNFDPENLNNRVDLAVQIEEKMDDPPMEVFLPIIQLE